MKAVVYSFDAYVSVIILLIGLGILLTYGSIESNYVEYYQVKMLSIDSLRILIESGNIGDLNTVSFYLENSIPEQYSYRFYRASDPQNSIGRGSVDNYKNIKVVTSIVLPYGEVSINTKSPFKYKTCNGGDTSCIIPSEETISPSNLGFEKYVLEVSIWKHFSFQ